MELVYVSLYDYVKGVTKSTFSILQAVDLMLQIAQGVNFYHCVNLVDRDFISGNILVQVVDPNSQGNPVTEKTSLNVKLADFGRGLSRVENQTADLGKTKWMAPDRETTPKSRRFTKSPSDCFNLWKKLDVYNFAIICSEIFSTYEPFVGEPCAEIAPRIVDGLRLSLPDKIPGRLATLIQACWSGDPQLRPEFSAICTELQFSKGLLLQGHNIIEGISRDFNLDRTSVKVQGPWGGSGGRMFYDGMFTYLKRIVVHFDHRPTNVWYLELEYVVDNTSFIVGHGRNSHGDVHATVDIDGPSEYLAQIEGSFGTSARLENSIVVQTLTFHTNKKTYGPFGRERETGVGETKFKSDYGRIVGFFGREHECLDQIGCLLLPGMMTTPTL